MKKKVVMKKSLKVCLLLSVSLFFIIVANAGKEEQKVDDRFPFRDLPDELQDNIWEKVGSAIPPITKNLLLKSYCRKISNQEENFDPTKAKIIANNLDPLTVKKIVAQDVLQLPRTAQREIGKQFEKLNHTAIQCGEKYFQEANGITFDNEGNLVSWRNDTIRISNIETGQILNEFFNVSGIDHYDHYYVRNSEIKDVIFDNNGQRFAAYLECKTDNEGFIVIWDIASKKLLEILNCNFEILKCNHTMQLIFDKKDHLFFNDGVIGNLITMWNLNNNGISFIKTWNYLDHSKIDEEIHSHFLRKRHWISNFISLDELGKELSSRNYLKKDKVISLHKISYKRHRICNFILDESGEKLFSWDEGKKVYIWNVENRKYLKSILFPYFIDHLMLNGDDLFLFFWRSNKCDNPYLALRLNLKDETIVTFRSPKDSYCGDDDIWGEILDKEKRLLFTYSKDETIRLWDIGSGECLKVFDPYYCLSSSILGIRLYGQGKLISWEEHSIIRIWNIETGRCINSFKVYWQNNKNVILLGLEDVLEKKMMEYLTYN